MVNKTHKHIIALAGIFAAALALNAQDAGAPLDNGKAPASAPAAPAQAAATTGVDDTDTTLSFLDNSPEAVGNFGNAAEQSAQTYLASKNPPWQQGLNKDNRPGGLGERYIAIGIAGVGIPPTDERYSTMRRNAFNQAMLDAKAKMAAFIATDISSDITDQYGGDPENKAKRDALAAAASSKDAGFLDKIKMRATEELDKALQQENIAPSSPAAVERAGKLIHSNYFTNSIKRRAQELVTGLIVNQIFEENGKIAVVALYSDSSIKLAAFLAGKSSIMPTGRPFTGGTLAAWINSLTTNDLYSSFGVQPKADEHGNIVLLAYAQSPADSDSPLSYRAAKTTAEAIADGDIRQFIGANVVYDDNVDLFAAQHEMDNGVHDVAIDDYQSSKIRSYADALKISGIYTAKTWTTKDKRSGKYICGVIRAWSLDSQQAAQNVKRAMNSPATGAAKPAPAPAQAPAPETNTSGKYRSEGIRGDDF